MHNLRTRFYKAKDLFGLGIGYHKLGYVRDAIKRKRQTLHSIEIVMFLYVLTILWETGDKIDDN